MKIKKFKYILPIMLIGVLSVVQQVYAKTSIEIKPSSTVYTNKTISDFFDESMAMKNVGEGLEGANVDVHMSTNMDWAIVSYFSNSAYGTNGKGKNAGVTTSINGVNYLSTNGNATGVMNFGKTYTYTAGVTSNYTGMSDSSGIYNNRKSIIENATNNNYVDMINVVSKKSMAANGWYSSEYALVAGPAYCSRLGLFGFFGGIASGGASWKCDGWSNTSTTFRPAIWN